MRGREVALIVASLMLVACAEAPTSTPTSTVIQTLTYPERVELVVACIEEQGFVATSYEGFGISVEYSSEERGELASQVEGQCWQQIDERFPPPPPLSPEERYKYMLDVAECLRELGHAVPEAPTLDAYVDQMSADPPPVDLWDPYAIVARRGVNTWEIQRDACLPYPWAR